MYENAMWTDGILVYMVSINHLWFNENSTSIENL